MNSFFVSCHQIQNSNLKNKVVVVSGNSRRAVVSSASYEARKYGIKSGMPLYQAKLLYPEIIVINVQFPLYIEYSQKIWKFLKDNFTHVIEICSIDEYCLDITDIYPKYGSAKKCTQAIQKQILETFSLPCSIGLSFTKDLAKIASKLKKPQGITKLMKSDINKKLLPLNVDRLNGIGPKTNEYLKKFNIKTIGDLVKNKNNLKLFEIFGKRYHSWINQAQGKTSDKVEVDYKKTVKSVGRDITLEYDSNVAKYLQSIFQKIVGEVLERNKIKKIDIKTILCGFKVEHKKWKTKQTKITFPLNEKNVYQTVWLLFNQIWKHPQKVRAVRVALKSF